MFILYYVSTKRLPEHVLKSSKLASVTQLQFNTMNKTGNFSENQSYRYWNIDI